MPFRWGIDSRAKHPGVKIAPAMAAVEMIEAGADARLGSGLADVDHRAAWGD